MEVLRMVVSLVGVTPCSPGTRGSQGRTWVRGTLGPDLDRRRKKRAQAVNGSTTDRPSISAKSEMFRVARTNPPAKAMAAICASSTLMGRPPHMRAETRAAYREAAGSSKARQRPVSYTHLRAHETVLDLVCRLL